jgi:hypothetical protein
MVIGVDVSKAELVACGGEGPTVAVPNEPEAIRAWLSGLPEGGWLPPSLERALGGLDEEIRRRASGSELYARLLEVDGVGPATAAALVWTLGSRGFASADRAVAFAGLDVRARESGGRLAKRGPGFLRRLLFPAARSLCRSAPWRPVFERHAAEGTSHTAATVARKLLRIAWGLAAHPERRYDRRAALRT